MGNQNCLVKLMTSTIFIAEAVGLFVVFLGKHVAASAVKEEIYVNIFVTYFSGGSGHGRHLQPPEIAPHHRYAGHWYRPRTLYAGFSRPIHPVHLCGSSENCTDHHFTESRSVSGSWRFKKGWKTGDPALFSSCIL